MMFQRILIAAILLLLLSCQQKPDRIGMPQKFTGTIPDTVTLVSYNVENLFDMVDNGTEYDEYKPGQYNWNENTYEIKLNNIASVLAAMNADIAVLVEVENENAVQGLCKVLKEKKCAYPFYALGGHANRGSVMPVVLSKFPVLSETSFGVAVDAAAYNRNMLRADIFLGRDTLAVFACHWPSKLHKESARLENARLLEQRLAELPKGKDYVVAGDFNEDYDECETFHTMGGDDTRGETGLNHVLGTVSSKPMQFVAFTQKKALRAGAPGMYDTWLEQPEARRLSTMFKGRPETPDHILLPASMFDAAGISYVNHSFYAFTWNGRLLKGGAPYRWQMRYVKNARYHAGEGYSDHLPVVARFCRCAYRPDSLDTGEITSKAVSGVVGGFEDGAECWVSCVKQVKVTRDTVNPHAGKYCLKISGRAKENASAARGRMAVPAQGGQAALTMVIRGSGSLCFRMKWADDKKWTYFKGEDFSPAKAGKYTDYAFADWTSISLPLEAVPGSGKEIDVEIRTKKDREIKLFVDDVKMLCKR
ncbi:MAG TPA: endonuclease/exonuclease/phosphatase family protein [Chitinivibrionales bacterium]|nr:endonuclease/exonuclease/phosphatase family protein [Chitinivibrionales bacterium]